PLCPDAPPEGVADFRSCSRPARRLARVRLAEGLARPGPAQNGQGKSLTRRRWKRRLCFLPVRDANAQSGGSQMPAAVVTFTVQIGSGGFVIAHEVAQRLAFRYFDWEITSEAAARAGVSAADVAASERVPGFLERIMRRLLSASAIGTEESSVVIPSEPAPVRPPL